MTSQEIIKNRWKKTDKELIDYYPKLKSIFKNISDEVLDLYEELNITRGNINLEVPSRVKRKFLKKIREWKNDGLVTGYFEYLIGSLSKYTYGSLLKILVYGIYLENHMTIYEDSKELLVTVANDCFNQAKKEMPPIHSPITIPDILDFAYIYKWLHIVSLNATYEDYMQTLVTTATDELIKVLNDFINREADITEEDIKKILTKQQNRILNINQREVDGEIIPNEFTYSGILETESRQVGNNAYVDPFPNFKCRFIAEMDERTTPMCVSLNEQIFNTKDENEFERYSDTAKGLVKYKFDGLVQGINLPPITDHFHWCRSTITYQVDLDPSEVREMIYDDGIK